MFPWSHIHDGPPAAVVDKGNSGDECGPKDHHAPNKEDSQEVLALFTTGCVCLMMDKQGDH